MKIPVRILILTLVLSSPTISNAEIFKCVAADGSITFSDTPCSHTSDEATLVDDLDSRVTTYDSEYPDGYGKSNSAKRYGQEIRADSPYAEEISRAQRGQASPPNYTDIPPEPVKPNAPSIHTRSVPGTPHMVPSTQGEHVLRTGERSYVDPQSGQVKQGQLIGGGYDNEEEYVDPEESQDYKDAMREYKNAQYDREVAIESEKHAAEFQDRNASSQYCGEMQYKITQAKQQGDSLDRQMDQLESSRPSSRASAEQRSNHHKRTKKSKESLKDKMSANRKQKREYSNNYRRLCR